MSDFSFRFQTPPTPGTSQVLMEANTGFGMPPPKPLVIPPLTKVETKKDIPALTPLRTTPVSPLSPLGGPDFGFSVGPQEMPIHNPIPRFVPHPFPRTGDNIQVGDLVRKKNGEHLYNGEEAHPYAVVVSLAPFILYSRVVDVYWHKEIDPEAFMVTGKATSALFNRCMASFKLITL